MSTRCENCDFMSEEIDLLNKEIEERRMAEYAELLKELRPYILKGRAPWRLKKRVMEVK